MRKLWFVRTGTRAPRVLARPPELLFSVDETPPRPILVLSAIQHLAVNAITLVFPLILAREAGLVGGRLIDFVSLSMLALGLATIFLCARSQFIGSSYLCPAGFSQIYLGASLISLRYGGIELAAGMTFVAGLMQIGLAPLLRRLRALLPAEIAGLVIAIVGLSQAFYGFKFIFGMQETGGFDGANLFTAALTLVTMTVLNIWTKGYTKIFCVLIGIVAGYAASVAFGVLDLSAIIPRQGLAVLRLPRLGNLGWSFNIDLLAPFAIASIATTLRTMGDISNAQRINDRDWVRPAFGSIVRGVAANGLATMICGLFGTCGVNSNSSSIGLSKATGITSRSVGLATGICFALLSFLPITAAVFAAMPAPVMGASLFFTSAFVFTSGLQAITARLLDSRKIVVIGFSFAMAMIADVYHDTLARTPELLQPILGNGLVLGTVSAVLLNLIMRIGVRKRVSISFAAGQATHEAVVEFLSEQGAHWGARRDIIDRAIYGVLQLLDVLEDVQGDIAIDASFDEFNLDVRVSYEGGLVQFPDERPSDEYIRDSEDGMRLLAGYMLRGNADRMRSETRDGRSSVLFHFDH